GAELGRLAERVAGAQRGRVRFANRVVRREALREPRLDRRDLVAEHPLHEPERPEILAAPGVALTEAEALHRLGRMRRDIDLDDLIAVERAALARILGVPRLLQAPARECVSVQDDQRA